MTQFQLLHELNQQQIEQLQYLFSRQWWTSGRSLEDINKMLASSNILFAYWDTESEKLVAFARVLTDHVFRAFIFDVIVDEELRGNGIGRQLMNDVLQKIAHIERVELYCKEDKIAFYEKLGFSLLAGTNLMRRK